MPPAGLASKIAIINWLWKLLAFVGDIFETSILWVIIVIIKSWKPVGIFWFSMVMACRDDLSGYYNRIMDRALDNKRQSIIYLLLLNI